MAREAGFQSLVEPLPLRFRVYEFLALNGLLVLEIFAKLWVSLPGRVDDLMIV